MIVVGLLALLVAAVPVALVVGLFTMLLGHVVAGLAVIGASILVAGAGVTIAVLVGLRHVRALVNQHAHRVVQLRDGDYGYE